MIGPPAVLGALCVGAGLVAHALVPLPLLPGRSGLIAGIVLMLAAVALALAAISQFAAHHEHPDPYKPTHRLIAKGIYNRTRNPIYVALLLAVLATAGLVNSVWILGSLMLFFLLLQYGVVQREEQYLSAKFGAEYDEYRRRVRRWI